MTLLSPHTFPSLCFFTFQSPAEPKIDGFNKNTTNRLLKDHVSREDINNKPKVFLSSRQKIGSQ